MSNNLWMKYNDAQKEALSEAKLSIEKDLIFRNWVASHGGVYVPITKNTPPNPYLSHIKNRNIELTSKDRFTLMNPAYALSQLMSKNSFDIKNKITSSVLLNPKNAPDEWEKKALNIIEKSRKNYSEKQTIDGKEYIRVLQPFVTKKDCLKCHGFQGYKVGDVRGGISTSIAMTPYYDKAFEEMMPIIIQFIILWLLGIIGLFFGYRGLKLYIKDKIRSYDENIYALVDMIEERDSYTAGHSRRVSHYCVLIAKEMGYNSDEVDLLRRSAMLHDIGKISTPDSILLKPNRLNSLEYDIIKEHVSSGYELLKKIDFYAELSEIMRHHHEHYDGSGYPEGLKGDDIPMLSQIMSAADAFDAMTTNRIYKGRMEVSNALEEIEKLSGKQFHPKIAYAALKALSHVVIRNDINQVPKTRLEKERFSYFYRDHITQAYNYEYLEFIVSKKEENLSLYKSVVTVSLHHFSEYNNAFSWEEGNQKLFDVANLLQVEFSSALLFRIRGDDFILISKDINMQSVKELLEPLFVNTPIELEYKEMAFSNLNLESLKDIGKLF
ncbi:MAG: DUF3365 domain-containing protein [Campylobacterota bacterium]|nr:DUF3365 domain-containing protein [Campylobacterota bacterium]